MVKIGSQLRSTGEFGSVLLIFISYTLSKTLAFWQEEDEKESEERTPEIWRSFPLSFFLQFIST
jgi:hypothetical protein